MDDVLLAERGRDQYLDRLPDQLGPRVAEHRLGPGVDHHDAAGRVRDHDALGQADSRNALDVASLRRSDSSAALRAVTSRATMDAPMTAPARSRIGEIVMRTCTRLPCSGRLLGFDPLDRLLPQDAAEAGGDLVLLPVRGQDADRPGPDVVLSISVEPLGARIPGEHAPVGPQPDDRVVGRLHDRREQRARPLVLGDLALQGNPGGLDLSRPPSILDEDDQEQAKGQPGQRGQPEEHPAGLPRVRGRLLGLDLALLRLHGGDGGPNLLHEPQAATGEQALYRGVGAPLATELDGVAQLAELVGDERLQGVDMPALARIALGQVAEGPQVARRGVERGEIRGEIALVSGHQEAALSGLGIGHRREDAIQLTEDLAGLTDRLVLVGEIARADRDDHDGQHEGGGQRERDARAVLEEPEDHAAGPLSHAGCIVSQEGGPFKTWGGGASAGRGCRARRPGQGL